MKKNMGVIDRIFRVCVAAFLAVLYFRGYVSGLTGIIAIVVAVVFLLTSIVGNCPLYSLFGISTCRSKK